MQCPKCKTENPDDAKLCNMCGELFTTREPGGRGMVMRVGGYRAPKETRSGAWRVIGLVLAAGLLVAIIALLVLNQAA